MKLGQQIKACDRERERERQRERERERDSVCVCMREGVWANMRERERDI